jgi:hypothetical protein
MIGIYKSYSGFKTFLSDNCIVEKLIQKYQTLYEYNLIKSFQNHEYECFDIFLHKILICKTN